MSIFQGLLAMILPPKKPKCISVDYYLPEELIEHIFSFLPPKDLIQTSLLSKKWRNFWISAPSTNLSFNVEDPCSLDFFLGFLHCRNAAASPTVLKSLRIQRIPFCESRLCNKLVASALNHHLHNLYINGYAICPSMLSSPSLSNLELRKVSLIVDGHQISELPITCPDLETLTMQDCDFLLDLRVLVIRTSKLRNLIMCHGTLKKCDLELHTPKLSFLFYQFRNKLGYGALECWFGKQDAWDNIDSWFDTCRIANRLQPSILRKLPLERASHARISANGDFRPLEGITSALGRLLKSSNNIRSLDLNLSFFDASSAIQLVSLLVCNCSSIEILVLNAGFYIQASDDAVGVPELPQECNLSKLKYIVVQGVQGLDCELEFFTLLLRNAVNFQRMIIIEYARKFFNNEICNLKQFRMKLCQQFPKARFSIQLL